VNKQLLINRLKAKPDLNQIVTEVTGDPTILPSFFEIVREETSGIKYVCTKIIRMLSEQKPEIIYPYFAVIAEWLFHPNSFIKWDGIIILSNLTTVDREDKFGTIYQDYFSLIHDPQMITAANVIGNAWKIVLAKPDLENEITGRLLKVPGITYLYKGEPSPECNCIVCGKVLDCFEHYFDRSTSQAAMLRFAEEQLNSSRKAVANNAGEFLKRHYVKKM